MSNGTSTIPAPTRLGTPFLIFCLYMFVLVGRPQDYIPSLAPFRLALLFTILTLLFTIFQKRERNPSLFRNRESVLYLLFFGIMCAGIPFSVYRRGSFDFVILGYVVNMVFYALFLLHVNNLEKFKRAVAVLMFSGLFFSLFGLLQGNFHADRYWTGSLMFDPNDVAFVEISIISFGMIILLGSFRILIKIVALISLLLSVLLTLYTGSRGGIIGLMALALLFWLLKIPNVKILYKVLITVLLIAAAVNNADKIDMERYLTLGDLDQDYNVSDEEGRLQIWKRGVQIFFENPITGVGVTGFNAAIGKMRERENLPSQRWQTAHNSYLLVMVETGIFGGTVFLLLIVSCLKTFNKFRKWREASLEKDFNTLSGLLLIGFVALLITAFFLSQAYSILFTLYFAISATLNCICQVIDKEKVNVLV